MISINAAIFNITKTLFIDPLEQFEVFSTFCKYLTNLSTFITLVLFLGSLFWAFGNNTGQLHTNISVFRTLVFNFVLGFIKENCYIKTLLFFPIIFHSFLFIAFGNFLGMIPYSVTITSSAMLAFFLSFMFLVGITIVGFRVHGFRVFGMFFPSGVPLIIAPFLVGIEFISYVSRTFSLAIRLFANMMSGHALLKILASFV